MKTGPRFLALYASLLVFLAVSCTSHQRPVAQSDAQAAMRGGSANVAAGVAAGTPGEVDSASPASQLARTQVMSATGPGPIVIRAVAFAETDPVSSLKGSMAEADATRSQPGIEINELNTEEIRGTPDAGMAHRDATLKGTAGPQAVNAMPSPSITFEGNSAANNTAVFGGTVAPPDTNGAVGPHHYVQMTNLLTGIYDKATGALLPPGRFALSPLFAKLGGVCATTNNGDPVVQYDKLADRWILSQFGFTATNVPPYHQCVAISKTSDPAGAYYAYDFQQPGQRVPRLPEARHVAGRLLHDHQPVLPGRQLRRRWRLRIGPREDAGRRPDGHGDLLQPVPRRRPLHAQPSRRQSAGCSPRTSTA